MQFIKLKQYQMCISNTSLMNVVIILTINHARAEFQANLHIGYDEMDNLWEYHYVNNPHSCICAVYTITSIVGIMYVACG